VTGIVKCIGHEAVWTRVMGSNMERKILSTRAC
jgi:hypothetical protein